MEKIPKMLMPCVALALLGGSCNLLKIFIMKKLIDEPSMLSLKQLSVVMFLAYVMTEGKSYAVRKYYLAQEISFRTELLAKIKEFPLSLLEGKKYYDDLAKISTGLEVEQEYILALEKIATTFLGVLGIYLLAWHNVPAKLVTALTVLLVATVVVSFSWYKSLGSLMYEYWQNYHKNARKFNYLAKVLSMKEYVEEKLIFAWVPFFSKEFRKEFLLAGNINRRLGRERFALEIKAEAVFLLYNLTAFSLLVYCCRMQEITMGFFITFFGYLVWLEKQIAEAVGDMEKINRYKKLIREKEIFVSLKENIIGEQTRPTSALALTISNVSFKYANERFALKVINLSLRQGRKYALVGVNGSGKTTLAKLMAGLYAPHSGHITRRSTAIVLFQDFNRYPCSLAENITLKQELSCDERQKLLQYLEQVGLQDLVDRLPHGINTELTTLKQGGVELSGGQWQRIALARLLWQEGDFYILDEPTASLDPLEEIRIFSLYNSLLSDKTVVYITHRLGLIKNVDEIFVLHNGAVVEHGSHRTLLQKEHSLYGKIFREQGKWYEVKNN